MSDNPCGKVKNVIGSGKYPTSTNVDKSYLVPVAI